MNLNKELEELNKAIEDFAKVYNALRSFLIDLKALDNPEVKTLFIKYQVKVE